MIVQPSSEAAQRKYGGEPTAPALVRSAPGPMVHAGGGELASSAMAQAGVVATDQLAPSLSSAPATPPARLSNLDAAGLEGLPAGFEHLAEESVPQLAADLGRQGARGAAARQLLAADAAVSLARLRCLQSAQALAFSGNDLRRALELDRLADAAHRRMIESLDLLARLDPPPQAIRISAHQAAIQVNNK